MVKIFYLKILGIKYLVTEILNEYTYTNDKTWSFSFSKKENLGVLSDPKDNFFNYVFIF